MTQSSKSIFCTRGIRWTWKFFFRLCDVDQLSQTHQKNKSHKRKFRKFRQNKRFLYPCCSSRRCCRPQVYSSPESWRAFLNGTAQLLKNHDRTCTWCAGFISVFFPENLVNLLLEWVLCVRSRSKNVRIFIALEKKGRAEKINHAHVVSFGSVLFLFFGFWRERVVKYLILIVGF